MRSTGRRAVTLRRGNILVRVNLYSIDLRALAADIFREMGDVFGVPPRPSNRLAGFKVLRERRPARLETTCGRAVILIYEAQELAPKTLRELRLLASTRFDSRPLLAAVLARDARLSDALSRDELELL